MKRCPVSSLMAPLKFGLVDVRTPFHFGLLVVWVGFSEPLACGLLATMVDIGVGVVNSSTVVQIITMKCLVHTFVVVLLFVVGWGVFCDHARIVRISHNMFRI